MRTWSLILIGALATIAAGCGGRAGEPPKPTRSLVADGVSVAERWDFGTCTHFEVTLRSGDVVDVMPPGVTQEGCPKEEPTEFLIGSSSSLTYRSNNDQTWVEAASGREGDGPGPLVFHGTVDGKTWVGVIASPYGPAPCWQFRFGEGEGAYLEGNAFRLVNGLVLPIAADYRPLTYPPDPFPLRAGDGMCLNEAGEVSSVQVWSSY